MKQSKGLMVHRLSELKKTSSWVTVGPANDKHQAPTNGLNLNVRAEHVQRKEHVFQALSLEIDQGFE